MTSSYFLQVNTPVTRSCVRSASCSSSWGASPRVKSYPAPRPLRATGESNAQENASGRSGQRHLLRGAFFQPPFLWWSWARHFGAPEDVLVNVYSILQSAAATAYEHADNQTGSNRKVAMGVVHLIELAQLRMDSVLDGQTVGVSS